MKTRLMICLLAAAVLLAGCQPTKENVGTVVGAGAGAAIGAHIGSGPGQLAAVAGGTLIGALIGQSIGRSLDEVDRMKMERTLETQPTGQAYSWQNPDSGDRYSMTPTRTYETASDPCREYTTEAIIDGKREVVHGTACRQPDGRWVAAN